MREKGRWGRVEVVKCEWMVLLRPPSALSYLFVLDISSRPQTKRKGEMSTRDRCLSVVPVHQTVCVDNAGFPDQIWLLTAWLHWPILLALLFFAHRSWNPSSRCDLLSCLCWAQYSSFDMLNRLSNPWSASLIIVDLNVVGSRQPEPDSTATELSQEPQNTTGLSLIKMWEFSCIRSCSRCLFYNSPFCLS